VPDQTGARIGAEVKNEKRNKKQKVKSKRRVSHKDAKVAEEIGERKKRFLTQSREDRSPDKRRRGQEDAEDAKKFYRSSGVRQTDRRTPLQYLCGKLLTTDL